MKDNKLWSILQIICVVVVVGGSLGLIFSTSEPTGNGNRTMVEKPWWMLPSLIGLTFFAFVGILAEVRRRNNYHINMRVILQTIIWIVILVGFLVLSWFLRGDL